MDPFMASVKATLEKLGTWLQDYVTIGRMLFGARSDKPLKAELAHALAPVWLPFSAFLTEVEQGNVAKVVFGEDDVIAYALKTTSSAAEGAAASAPDSGEAVKEAAILLTRRVPSHLMPIVNKLHQHGALVEQGAPPMPERTPLWQSLAMVVLPVAYIGFLGFVMYRFMSPDSQVGGSNSVGDRADGKGKRKTSFLDVAGSDKAREAVREVCDVLRRPEKYKKAGARLPTGLLLVGPPGTGKTMLARAMAAEAGIPFFYCSGSDFVEVFAGRGAARVRSLFQRAEAEAPAVIFIDEIDALGGSRHTMSMGNNEEREQTLNQLLACMDGFDTDRRVVVMGATNRFEHLDKALVRPGRFDRVVRVDLPDAAGRSAILKVHTRDLTTAKDVDIDFIAKCCDGFSGAELAALANEAAIRAVRQERDVIRQNDFLDAIASFAVSRSGGATQASQAKQSTAQVTLDRLASMFRSNEPANNGKPEVEELD